LKRFTASALISAQVPDEKRLHRRAPYTWWFDCSAQTVHKRWALASPALAGRTYESRGILFRSQTLARPFLLAREESNVSICEQGCLSCRAIWLIRKNYFTFVLSWRYVCMPLRLALRSRVLR
jgi:hypothetical protein